MKTAVPLLLVMLALAGCSQETENPKAKTMAAWKAFQKVDHDLNEANLPELKLEDAPSFPPWIKYYQDKAYAYSEIDTDGVDQLLTDHLGNSIKSHQQVAAVLQNIYADILALMKSRNGDIDASRAVGQLLADDEHQETAATFAELFYRFASDDDFQGKLHEIRAKHRSDFDAAAAEYDKVADADKMVAKSLSDKYGTPFVDVF